jgi:hypothetical protein
MEQHIALFYRHSELEEMPPYQFWSETEYIYISRAQKDGIEYYEYTDSHLFQHTEAVIYRKSNAVPTFLWIISAGSHQTIKGWHTFFKGRPGKNIGNLMLMTDSGWRGHIIVVLCRPSTNAQATLTFDMKHATFYNLKRTGINACIFQNYLNKHHKWKSESDIPLTAIVIKTKTSWNKSKLPLRFDQWKILFKEYSENDVKTGTQTCVPLLTLFLGCNLMITLNEDVDNGIANGTTCTFQKMVLKPEAEFEKIKMHGCWVHSVAIEAVEYLELEWQDCNHFVGRFRLTPTVGTFRVNYPISEFGLKSRIKTNIQLLYLPIIMNHATTGHKLQGKTVESLVLAEGSKVKNWAYIVLSRVRTLVVYF